VGIQRVRGVVASEENHVPLLRQLRLLCVSDEMEVGIAFVVLSIVGTLPLE